MRNYHIVSLLTALSSVATSQTWIPTAGSSSFPACAVQCPVLLQAQTTCSPPNAVQATQLNYENCFCQHPALQDLYTTGETRCTDQCKTTADRQLLSTWYLSFCKQVGQGIDPVTGASATTLSTVTTGATEPTASTTTITLTSGSTAEGGPWIKTHWQWIIMLIVLFFGLLGLGLGARWLKKRHDQKLDQNRATMSGFPVTEDKRVDRERALSPELWGPHQHMAATQGYQYGRHANGTIAEDGDNGNTQSKANAKRSSRVEVTELQPERSSRMKASRFRRS